MAYTTKRFTYNEAGQVTYINVYNSSAQDAPVIVQYHYEYYASGKLHRMTKTTVTTVTQVGFSYDVNGAVTQVYKNVVPNTPTTGSSSSEQPVTTDNEGSGEPEVTTNGDGGEPEVTTDNEGSNDPEVTTDNGGSVE